MDRFEAHDVITLLLDNFSLGLLFLSTVLLMALVVEVGFWLGRRQHRKQAKAQHSQVRAIMAATLGLLAFMLAFTFSIAQEHYEKRVENMVEEARVAGNAYLQAEFLREPYRTEVRAILRNYVHDRLRLQNLINAGRLQEAPAIIGDSEQMQMQLWDLAVANAREGGPQGGSEPLGGSLVNSVLALIDIHSMRLQAGLMNRISWVIWATLYLTAILSMAVMGYQAGLVGKRSPAATLTLVVAFAAVMMLIIDLDRPVMSLFDINNQLMVDLYERMDNSS